MLFWSTVAGAVELSLPEQVDSDAWQAELARVEAALPMPADARITVVEEPGAVWVVTVVDALGCALSPFRIPGGPTAIRAALWVAATLLDAPPCGVDAPRSPLPSPPRRPEPPIPPKTGPAPAAAVAPPDPGMAVPAPEVAPPDVAAAPSAPAPVDAAPALPEIPPIAGTPPFGVVVSAGAVIGTGAVVGGELTLRVPRGPAAVEVRAGGHLLRPVPLFEVPARTVPEFDLAATWGRGFSVGAAVRTQLRPKPHVGVGPTVRLALIDRRARITVRLDGWLEPWPEQRGFESNGIAYTVRSPALYLSGAVELGWLTELADRRSDVTRPHGPRERSRSLRDANATANVK